MVTPGRRRGLMTGGPTCGGNSAGSGRWKTVSCRGQDETHAAGIATEVPVSPAWLSHHPHAHLFSNRCYDSNLK